MDAGDRQQEIGSRLWRAACAGESIGGILPKESLDAVLEQYRLYIEMADRVSARRGLANSFFLPLNTGIFTLIAALGDHVAEAEPWWLVTPLVAVLGQCFAWFYMLRSYRLLNSAKYEVVGALEERLPASPFWRAEWWALGEGKDRSRYWPLSHIEQWMPVLFAAAYLSGFATVVLAQL